MRKVLRRSRGRRSFPARFIPPKPVVIVRDGDYLDARSRMDYLRQKMAAQGRMEVFDAMEPAVRAVASAAGTQHNTAVCWRAGCRTFEQAELAIAGVWDGE